MASFRGSKCEICEEEIVEYWCVDCESSLCRKCNNHHSRIKICKPHTLVALDNLSFNTNTFSHPVSKKCAEHNIEHIDICSCHDEVCCSVCLSSNNKHSEENQFVESSKILSIMSEIEQRLKKVETSIDNGFKAVNTINNSLRQDGRNIMLEIREVKQKFISRLNILEHALLKDLRDSETEIQKQMQQMTKQLFEISTAAAVIRQSLHNVNKGESGHTTFLQFKIIETNIKRLDFDLKTLSKNGCFRYLHLKSGINNQKLDSMLSLKDLGSIVVQKGLPICICNNRQNQIEPLIQKLSFNITEINLIATFDIPNVDKVKGIRGCTVSSNGKMIFSDYAHKKLIFLNEDGSFDKTIDTFSFPKDVCLIDDKTIAVSTPRSLQIVDIETKKITFERKTEGWSCGLVYLDGCIFLCEASKGVQCIDVTKNSMRTLIHQDYLPGWCYLATCGDNIYQTIYEKNIVVCFNKHGEKQWEFKDESVLTDPTCITVDENSTIYVTSETSNSVVMISSDGKYGKSILGEAHQMKNPWGIHIDTKGGTLLVANKFGPAFVYNIL